MNNINDVTLLPWHMIMLSIVLLSIVLILAISLGFNIYLFLSQKKNLEEQKSSRDADRQNSQAIESGKFSNIEKYLADQIEQTKSFLHDNPNKSNYTIDKKVIALRTAYLNIEKKALSKRISSKSYWVFIEARLIKLMMVFLPALFGNENHIKSLEKRISLLKERIETMGDGKITADKTKAVESLDKFLSSYKNNFDKKNLIDRFLQKMEGTIERAAHPEYREFYERSRGAKQFAQTRLDKLGSLADTLTSQKNNIHELESQVNSFKEKSDDNPENQEIRDQYERLKTELATAHKDNEGLTTYIDALRRRISDFERDATRCEDKMSLSIANSTESREEAKSLSEEMDKLSQGVSSAMDDDAEQLRNLLQRQRNSIASLDATIDKLRQDLKKKKEAEIQHESEINRLNQFIQDSDVCIKTLEVQLDEFFNQKHANLSGATSDTSDTSKDYQQLTQELNRIRAEMEEAIRQVELNTETLMFYTEALKADSIEDLSALVFQVLHDYGCDPSLEIFCNTKSVIISTSGTIKKHDQLLVNNMAINETNEGADGRSIRLKKTNIKGVIRSHDNTNTFKNNRESILNVIDATNRLVEKIGAVQDTKYKQKTLNLCQNKIKKLAFDVDGNLGSCFDKTKNTLDNNIYHLKDFAKTEGVPENKLKPFDDAREKIIKTMDENHEMRASMRKQFLGIINELNNV